MCHDLLAMDGNKYTYEVIFCWFPLSLGCNFEICSFKINFQVPSKTGGNPEKKEALLGEHDPVWLEIRHTHIADVCYFYPIKISY